MPRGNIKREVDLQTMVQWIEPGSRVLDLGCGRGHFLEHLHNSKNVYGVGIDRDLDKITSCIQRGINAYHGDAENALSIFQDGFFDWVVCSRMLHELDHPGQVIESALRVGKNVAAGFMNFGFWRTRISVLTTGQRPQNDVYKDPWHSTRPSNPLSIDDFEKFCAASGYSISHRVFLDSTWLKPLTVMPNLLAGYAVYAIGKK